MNISSKIKNSLSYRYWNFIKFHYPFFWGKHLYKIQLNKKVDFNNPRDLNDKIQWLEFYTDTSLWTNLADKYAVRNFVKARIGEEFLIPLIGCWEVVKNINFQMFPNQFVIKPNNGSYDCIVVKEKSKIDFTQIKARLIKSLNNKFGYDTAEPHYHNISPRIIAEKLLTTDEPQGLVDYKIWCFNGVPHSIFTCFNRNHETHHADYMTYDLKWNRQPDMLTNEFRSDCDCPRPANLQKMLEIAAKLSYGLPQCRVDLYNIKGKIYFGEMTLTSNYGMMPYFTQQALDEMGRLCVLPKPSPSESIKCFFKRYLPQL